MTHGNGNRQSSQSRQRWINGATPLIESFEQRLMLAASFDLGGVEFRSLDGTGNNLAAVTQGAARTEQIRFGYGARFPDGFGDEILTDTSTPSRTNARTISNVIHAQSGSVPSARQLTDWSFQWGQWITHDMGLTLNGSAYNQLSTGAIGDFSIPVLDANDPMGPNSIPFNRSEYVPGTGVSGNRREVINSVTSYIDASTVYGSDPARAAALRTFENGKLKTSAGGSLLPLNTAGLPNEDVLGLGDQLFLAGDIRSNEQVGLTAVHTLFVREHNRLADRIHQLYPTLDDEQIYQIARRIVGAEQQIITYKEYLPALFGNLAPRPEDAVYDPSVDASITNSFAHAIFRFGHSQIGETTLLVDNGNHLLDTLSIRDAFANPDLLKSNPTNMEFILKGLATQVGQEVDSLLVDGIRNNLFGPAGAGGTDLAALDIQRGRDHGLPDYNNLRVRYGLTAVTDFDQISSNPQIQARLQQLFGSVDNIDVFTGALAEDHLPGTSVGPLILANVGNQFERLRDGDRFFYTNDPFLQSKDIRRIIDLNQVSLSWVIRQNTKIANIQKNVFFFDKPAKQVNAQSPQNSQAQTPPVIAAINPVAPQGIASGSSASGGSNSLIQPTVAGVQASLPVSAPSQAAGVGAIGSGSGLAMVLGVDDSGVIDAGAKTPIL